jgi:hypothetical protein
VPVLLLVDEFAAIPGTNYETIRTQLARFGGSLPLATQRLAQLDVLERAGKRALRVPIFASISGLFVFNVSTEDACYLVPKPGGLLVLAEEDLGVLNDVECYAWVSHDPTRQPPCLKITLLRSRISPAPESVGDW